MAVPQYITLAGGNRLSLQDLVQQIAFVISDDGLGSIRLKNSLEFVDSADGVLGGIKYDTTTDSVVYSTDGGRTWNPITSDSFWWVSGKTYTSGTIVLHTSGWYACRTTTTDVPGESDAWDLLTAGSIIKYVRNSAQLKAALETRATHISIVLVGSITTAIAASVTATTVTIWSDEATRISADITISASSGASIFWHASGTKVTANATISCSAASLYIEHLAVTYGRLTLQNNVKYQRVDGNFTGGTYELWADASHDHLLEKDLSKLDRLTADSDMRVYVHSDARYGYVSVLDIAEKASEGAFKYFKIHATGGLNGRPTTAAQGYTYYAEDTGDMYIMGKDNVWGPPVHIRGPQGRDGNDGSVGYTIMPTITTVPAETTADSDQFILSWEARKIPITQNGPVVPDPVNIKGTDGKDAFEVWKREENLPNATIDDYYLALGIGSRKTTFVAADVNANNVVRIYTDYPVIGVEDNDGYHWAIPNYALRYKKVAKRFVADLDLTKILEEKQMLAQDASITLNDGVVYRPAPDENKDNLFAWETYTSFPWIVYTNSETPRVGDPAYYTAEENEAATLNMPIERVTEHRDKVPISGNWYALMSCGGGNDGKSSISEIVAAKTLLLGESSYVKDIMQPSFESLGVVYVRYEEGDIPISGMYAWKAGDNSVVYTNTLELEDDSSVCYPTPEIGLGDQQPVTAYMERSTALHRRFEVGIPEGPEGSSYGVPAAYDHSKTYAPVSHSKRRYDTVLHQGGTWLYIGAAEGSGNPPPELPATSNDYWQLIAAPGAPGEDIGTGISVHKFELRKPISNMNLFLEIMRSPTGVLSDAVRFLDTLTDAEARQKVRVWDKYTNIWVQMPATGFDSRYNNAAVTVDMSDVSEERYLFYRWRTPSNSNATWQSAVFPNSNPIDYLMGLTPDGTITFTGNDVRDSRYVTVSPLRYILAILDENDTQYPVTPDMVVYNMDEDTSTVDLTSIMDTKGITEVTGSWKLLTNVGASDTIVEGDHTHINKSILDTIGIDLLGNIMIDGVVLVSAEDRNSSRYLIDPGLFPETQSEAQELTVDPNGYSIAIERVDPGQYSAVKVSLYRDAGIYNSTMSTRTLNPSQYGTYVTTVDSEI